MGLFSYPILMAADILIYDSNSVPVGRDQKQHLEITRDLAMRFNHLYGETLVVPEALIEDQVAVIPGLDGQKMSKSYDNIIPLFAQEKTLRKAIMKIETDSRTVEETKVPEECNVYKLYCCFASDQQHQELAGRYRTGGMGYGEAKQVCFEAIRDELKEAAEVYQRIRDDRDYLEGILEAGRDTARRVSRQVIGRVRGRVGL